MWFGLVVYIKMRFIFNHGKVLEAIVISIKVTRDRLGTCIEKMKCRFKDAPLFTNFARITCFVAYNLTKTKEGTVRKLSKELTYKFRLKLSPLLRTEDI